MSVGEAKRWVKTVREARPWRPGHASFLLKSARGSCDRSQHDDWECLVAVAAWLEAAQDRQSDGGISGRYRLDSGWSSSYPETTGYAIPTFLALAEALGQGRFRERAERAVGFLLSIQLPCGGFPGMEIALNVREPSAFNSAQIIHGLLAWHSATSDARSLEAALRAGEWLVSIQEPDGSWLKYFYNGVATDYAAHLACWIAELGAHTGENRLRDSASRHLDWVLSHVDPHSGWFRRAGFTAEQHDAGEAFTHTIAYTIWGVLRSSEILGREDGIAAASHAAHSVARRLELARWLPGVLDARWRGRSTAACLTGNCQMALIWLRLYDRTADAALLNAALKAIDLVKAAQDLDNLDPGIRGGIAGSHPVWGEYITNALPNWAAKYFIDALLAKRAALSRIAERPRARHGTPSELSQALPPVPEHKAAKRQRIVLVTSTGSTKVQRLLAAWQGWGFEPSAVVVEKGPIVARRRRIFQIVRDQGVSGALQRLARSARPVGKNLASDSGQPGLEPVLAFCARRGIRAIEVETLTSPAALEAVAALSPDLLVHAGAGIIRLPLLRLSRLGMVNAHMGLLPFYRGMNVTEWAAFNGDPIGCTVHLIDQGIDTGDIVVVHPVDACGATDIASLRASVDAAQVELLGEVVGYVAAMGELPPCRSQRAEEGRQFFAMHGELAKQLEIELASRGEPVPSTA
jgi:folate-dependent phosphoribosylglycinamide formyltransferase PurN